MARGTLSLRTMLPMAQLDAPWAALWIEMMRSPWKYAVPPLRSITASWRQPMVGLPWTRAFTVSCADLPLSSKSRPPGPRVGSVRCWVSTAPTPARAYGQREPTPMLEVVTAAPNIPVRLHMPTNENVTA